MSRITAWTKRSTERSTREVPYSELAPPPELRSLVACFWSVSGDVSEHRVLPDGCIDVLVGGGDGARVVGTMTRAIVASTGGASVFGVRFRPGEAARVAPIASHDLTDLDAPLSAAWGDDGLAFEERALEVVDDPSASMHLFMRALVDRLARHGQAADLRVRAAAAVLARGGSVREASRHAELCERQLSRRFTARVGVAPKTFARVMRLQRAVAEIGAGASASRAATVAGYSDQAHFTRDAKDLAGVTPVRFVQDARAAAQ